MENRCDWIICLLQKLLFSKIGLYLSSASLKHKWRPQFLRPSARTHVTANWEIILPSEPERCFILNRLQMKVEVSKQTLLQSTFYVFQSADCQSKTTQLFLDVWREKGCYYSFLQMHSSVIMYMETLCKIFLKLENTVVDAWFNKVLSQREK